MVSFRSCGHGKEAVGCRTDLRYVLCIYVSTPTATSPTPITDALGHRRSLMVRLVCSSRFPCTPAGVYVEREMKLSLKRNLFAGTNVCLEEKAYRCIYHV